MGDLSIAVVGAHLTGMPLNHQLTDRGAALVRAALTAPHYRLFDLGLTPPRPGLVRVAEGGRAIEVEVWRLPADQFGEFVDALASPMAIGHVELADGSWVSGFGCEPYALAGAADVSRFGGWRAYQRGSLPFPA